MRERLTEMVLGIPVFTWTGCDEAGDQTLMFYECEFLLPELAKYSGACVSVDHGWNRFIATMWAEGGVDVDFDINLLEVPSFLTAISEKTVD